MSRYLKEKGAVLVYVMVLMVCGSIITMTVFMRNLHQYKFSLIDRKVKTASYYANNAITDMMRQFSQEQYSDHYSAAAVDRSAASFNNGFAEVEIAPDDSDHTLYIEATGMYGSDVNDPDFTKRLTVMIKFISDFTAFGSYIDGDFETSGDDAVYDGPMWWNGDWEISGDNCTCMGNVYVLEDISTSGWGDVEIFGDLYYGGSRSGNITVHGNSYNYFPLGDYPDTINLDYYEAHYHVKYTAADQMADEDGTESPGDYVRLTFNADGTIDVNGGLDTITIPAGGIIIYGDNCNIRVQGTVHGRVTVVAQRLKVRNDLFYANGTHSASEDDSFAGISIYEIYYVSQTGAMEVHGSFYQQDTSNSELDTDNNDYDLYGTRNRGHHVAEVGDWTLHYDPYLNEFPSPGLPEKAKIINWHLR